MGALGVRWGRSADLARLTGFFEKKLVVGVVFTVLLLVFEALQGLNAGHDIWRLESG